MTENSEIDINDFMLNRPSRIYYHFKYKKLDEASVKGYCKDHKVGAVVTKEIIELSRRSKIFSFDMLQSIVEEHLRFNCSVEDATTDLNIDTRENRGAMIEIIKIMERNTNVEREIAESPFVQKPDRDNYVYIKVKNDAKVSTKSKKLSKAIDEAMNALADMGAPVAKDSEDSEASYEEIYVNEADLAYEKEGQLVYETDKFIFVAKNVPVPQSTYFKFF